MVYGVTGHRSSAALGYGVDDSTSSLSLFARQIIKDFDCERVITGMALGWDIAVAHACLLSNIPYVAALPYKDYGELWTAPWRTVLDRLLSNAADIQIVCQGEYHPSKLKRRNRFIVDRCDHLLVMFDNRYGGGTHHTLKYAEEAGRSCSNVANLWIEDLKINAQEKYHDIVKMGYRLYAHDTIRESR